MRRIPGLSASAVVIQVILTFVASSQAPLEDRYLLGSDNDLIASGFIVEGTISSIEAVQLPYPPGAAGRNWAHARLTTKSIIAGSAKQEQGESVIDVLLFNSLHFFEAGGKPGRTYIFGANWAFPGDQVIVFLIPLSHPEALEGTPAASYYVGKTFWVLDQTGRLARNANVRLSETGNAASATTSSELYAAHTRTWDESRDVAIEELRARLVAGFAEAVAQSELR